MMALHRAVVAALDESMTACQRATPGPWRYATVDSVGGGSLYDRDVMIGSLDWDTEPGNLLIRRDRTTEEADANGAHIERHSPDRMLRLYGALREIVVRHQNVESQERPGVVWCNACQGQFVSRACDVVQGVADSLGVETGGKDG